MQYVAACLSAAGLLYSLFLAKYEFGKGFDPHSKAKVLQAIVLSFWILAPPIWFWFEYFFLYKGSDSTTDKPALDDFKHGQDQASKIWLALVTLLLGLYFGKDLIRDSSPNAAQGTQPSSGESQSRQGSQSTQPPAVVSPPAPVVAPSKKSSHKRSSKKSSQTPSGPKPGGA